MLCSHVSARIPNRITSFVLHVATVSVVRLAGWPTAAMEEEEPAADLAVGPRGSGGWPAAAAMEEEPAAVLAVGGGPRAEEVEAHGAGGAARVWTERSGAAAAAAAAAAACSAARAALRCGCCLARRERCRFCCCCWRALAAAAVG